MYGLLTGIFLPALFVIVSHNVKRALGSFLERLFSHLVTKVWNGVILARKALKGVGQYLSRRT